MKRKTWMGVAVVAFILAFGSLAKAADTSPYLIGVWEASFWEGDMNGASFNGDGFFVPAMTDFVIVNPTTIKLKVYAVFFTNNGTRTDICFKKILNPNAKWYIPPDLSDWLSQWDFMGTVKFIALPATATRLVFDSNAVIGGYQNRYVLDWWMESFTVAQADLKGVAINLYTQGEVKIADDRQCWDWDQQPATFSVR